MRTTLTLDDDVAAQLDSVRKLRQEAFRDTVNEALRRGLKQMASANRPRRRRFRTGVMSLGRCHVGDIDNVAETLALAEGDAYR